MNRACRRCEQRPAVHTRAIVQWEGLRVIENVYLCSPCRNDAHRETVLGMARQSRRRR